MGFKWVRMASNRFQWVQMVPTGIKLVKMSSFGLKMVKMGFLIGQNWAKLVDRKFAKNRTFSFLFLVLTYSYGFANKSDFGFQRVNERSP